MVEADLCLKAGLRFWGSAATTSTLKSRSRQTWASREDSDFGGLAATTSRLKSRSRQTCASRWDSDFGGWQIVLAGWSLDLGGRGPQGRTQILGVGSHY